MANQLALPKPTNGLYGHVSLVANSYQISLSSMVILRWLTVSSKLAISLPQGYEITAVSALGDQPHQHVLKDQLTGGGCSSYFQRLFDFKAYFYSLANGT